MKRSKDTNTHVGTATQTAPKAKRIKLGIDVHKASYRVVRQIDDAHPQLAQKFTPEEFLKWAGKQLSLAEKVHSRGAKRVGERSPRNLGTVKPGERQKAPIAPPSEARAGRAGLRLILRSPPGGKSDCMVPAKAPPAVLGPHIAWHPVPGRSCVPPLGALDRWLPGPR